ncbi:hypothetical protein J2R98_002344 [Alkalibacillus filiformis]|uniref:Uncharacterized protein n=1 Tax=Alkalibacillus filiformis TaxID=200990 RepID=A0ABU0DVL1_9BACI|nr:hypothetical protein [Alkalibacillus filiformis]MDQ0352499.1 hypothetical protein [Alkalibacillus filiformis]
MNRKVMLPISFVLMIVFVGCSQQPDIDVSKTLDEWRESFESVEVVAASFDGEENIKIRLMVEEQITEDEAALLMDDIFESIIEYSNQPDVWDYYNGYFDIKSYDDGLLYEATQLKGEDLEIASD